MLKQNLRRFSLHRVRLVLLSLAVLAVWWTVSQSPGQEPAKKPPVEEEDPVKRPGGKPPPLEADVAPPTDLLLEAVRATNPEIKDLFRRMAVPHDTIVLQNGRKLKVAPVIYYLGPNSTFVGQLNLKPFDDDWKVGNPVSTARRDIKSASHYEQSAVAAVDEFLQAAEPRKSLTPLQRLDAAEKVLAAALRFHRPAPDRRAREGGRWKEVETALFDRLQAVRLDRLHEMVISGAWEDALAWGDQLTRVYSDAKVHERIVQELAKPVERSLRQERYEEVQNQLRELERLPNSAAVTQPIAARLRSQAADLLNQAKGAREKNNLKEANELVNKADRMWPRLEGLRDFRWKLNKDHPTLVVGVRELPISFSPATAVLDSEKQAVELLFENLVEPFDAAGGQSYEPALAIDLPSLTPRGRELRLDADAYWSNGDRVTATDVQETVRLMNHPAGLGRHLEWARVMDMPTTGRDAFTVHVGLRQGFIDPLSFMTFKILPASARLDRPDDPQFARRPIGSGPYVLADETRLEAERQSRSVVFVANPSYRRSSKPQMPHIQEIRFYQSRDPLADFAQGRLHFLADATAKETAELRRPGNGLDGLVSLQTLRNRRIYFLAVNHRRRLLQNTHLRKAIAHAINRTEILDELFRGDLKNSSETPHRPLNGPYPPGSWACDPTLPLDPYKRELAAKEAEEARKTFSKIRLTLKFPDDDDSVKQACTRIREQVQDAAGIELVLVPTSRRSLHKEVETDHDYDLAYYSHDYPSEAYWLWPLFNPEPRAREPGGRNYLGYHNDGSLERWFHRAMGHREFSKVQDCTHKIQAELWAKMPLIPLWQLDTVVAVHKDLVPSRIDPLLIFTDVERWKISK
jgi:peptide/nickel transport system substrate-binding protein